MTIPTLNVYHRTTNSGFNVQNERGVATIIKRVLCTHELSSKPRSSRRRRRQRSIKKKNVQQNIYNRIIIIIIKSS